MQGARAAQISVENTSSTSDQRGSFLVPGPQSQTSFAEPLCRTPQPPPNIILCLIIVLAESKLVTQDYSWVSGATSDVLIFLTVTLFLAGILHSQSLLSSLRWLSSLILNSHYLLSTLFPFGLSSLHAEFPFMKTSNEDKDLKFSIWIFRHYWSSSSLFSNLFYQLAAHQPHNLLPVWLWFCSVLLSEGQLLNINHHTVVAIHWT